MENIVTKKKIKIKIIKIIRDQLDLEDRFEEIIQYGVQRYDEIKIIKKKLKF